MTWQTTPFVLLGLVLLGGFAWYERRRPPARVVALVAAMAALAVVGRLAFAPIPNVKPTTDIVLFAGYALGAVPGFVVGAVTALVSNVFFGHGPWTAWQMVAWGGVGAGGAVMARLARGKEIGRLRLAAGCALASLAFGAFMDLYQLSLAARQDLDGYLAVSGTSLPYNLAHVVGSVAFCLLIGPAFLRALRRYRRRFEVSWAPPERVPAGAAAIVAALVALTVALTPLATAAEASPSSRAVGYLERAQNRDGGFGGERGQSSNQLFTGWSALGLASAGRNPREVARKGGRSLIAYVRGAGSLRDTGELERTILLLRASGLSARRFRGRNLVAELVRRRSPNGSWRGNVAHTAFGVFALRATGEPVGPSVRWLEGAQNSDGGFGFVASAQSDVDDTGAALQALAGSGGPAPARRRAVDYLRKLQNGDGGFGQSQGRSSNAQSTAWAVQGLVAAGVRPESLGRSPLRYLVRLQRADGHIAYSRTSDQTPVWVTAQALTALRRDPFPITAVPLVRRPTTPRRPERAERAAAAAPRRADPVEEKARKERSGHEPASPVGDVPRSEGVAAFEPEQASDRLVGQARAEGGSGPSAGALVAACASALVLLLLLRRMRGRRTAAG